MTGNSALHFKFLKIFLCWIIILTPVQSLCQTLSSAKFIEVSKASNVHQTQLFAELIGDLLKNFNEKKYNSLISEVHRYLSKNNDKRVKARLFIYERFAYPVLGKPDTLNRPSHYLKIIKAASTLGDEQLLSELYCKYAMVCEPNIKLYYLLKCIEIRERIGFQYFHDIASNYYWASELLYSITDYRSSASYASRGLTLYSEKARRDFLFQYILAADLTAASYLKAGQADSAIYYYTHIGKLVNDKMANPKKYESPITTQTLQIWQGVVMGGLGKAYLLQKKYGQAYKLLSENLKSSTTFQQWDDVAELQNTLANIDQLRGHINLARSRYLQAYQLASKTQKLPVLIVAAERLSSIFEVKKQFDSAFLYHKRYLKWKESLDRKINQSRLDLVKAQVDFEKIQKSLQKSQSDLNNQKRIRNTILIGILFLTSIALLLYNRSRLRMSLKNAQLEKARQQSEAERIYAQKQIDDFVKNAAEKNNLIHQLQSKIVDVENSEVTSTLKNFVILTEEHWKNFKDNFETINPNFLYRLRQKMPHITVGEQRIVMLAKLGFNTREMANATGVSTATIRSVMSRLRKKFDVNTDIHSFANAI